MNLIQMRYFFEVCRWQNITKAAENLHVSQPTISVAMQTLEAETGLNLFRRNGKKILISRDGNVLLTKIRPILEEIDHLEHEINDMTHRRNHIRVAVPPQIGIHITPLLLGEFREKYPEIVVEIIETGSVNSLRMLKDEKLDLALMNYTEDCDGSFIYRKLGVAECCFCTYKSSPFAQRPFITIEDIKDEALVLLDGTFNLTHLVHQVFTKHGFKPKVIHYSPYLHTVRNIVRQKIASSFLMRHAILPDDDIISIPVKEPMYLEAGIVMKKGRQIYADERILIKFIKENFI